MLRVIRMIIRGMWDSTGNFSAAFGFNNKISYPFSFSGGYQNEIIGNMGTAFGQSNIVNTHGFAAGVNNSATGNKAVAFGNLNNASGSISTVFGESNESSGNFSVSMGKSVYAPSFGEITVGIYGLDYTPQYVSNWYNSDRVFSVGNGTSSTNRSNALTVLKDGRNRNWCYSSCTKI